MLSAIRSWISAPIFLVNAVLLLQTLLRLLLLFVAAPAAALYGCSCGGSSATAAATLLAALVGAASGYFCGRFYRLPLLCSFCYFHERSSGCFYWCSCSPASEDAPTMAAASAAAFM